MKKILGILCGCVLLSLSACDLQPKITSLPDSVGEFITTRYPALLADPETEPEIYNSAVTDYGVYASPELYGSGGVDDYVLYSSVDDYVLKPDYTIDYGAPLEVVATAPESPILDDYITVPSYIPAIIRDESEIIVAKGDTLYSLAIRHSTTVQELANANNLSEPYMLSIGQKIKIPRKTTDVIELPPKVVSPQLAVKDITVAKGDTLYSLARKHSMSTDELAKINNLKVPYNLSIGQKLKVLQQLQASDVGAIVVPPAVTTPAVAVKSTTKVDVKEITVARGDTLYSLSRKYQIPVNDLAVMNKLTPPFALSVGQKVKVPNLAALPVASATPVRAGATPVTTGTKPPVVTTPKTTVPTATKPKTTTATTSPKISSDPSQKLPAIAKRSSSKFSWPVRGTVLSSYGAKSNGLFNDGINISAKAGTKVAAAENGVVAYAGNEVKGMGNLVIVQHDGGWMTVYAHMDKLSVRRGVKVTVGQQVGTVGQTGKVDKPQLHFEIRKGTKAYDPSQYLKK